MKPTLLIMAAGMGSRYGGLKQLDGLGPHGEVIMDYSVFDAMRAGFGKVVFVVRRAMEDAFRKEFIPRYRGKVPFEIVVQELDAVPAGFTYNPEREKPWGTNHAVMMGAAVIREPFAVINADDYYGVDAFKVMSAYLQTLTDSRQKYCMIGFRIGNTLSESGSVTRGVCTKDAHENLTSIVERLYIVRENGQVKYRDEHDAMVAIPDDTPVSMNMWGFTPDYFSYSEELFKNFLKEKGQELKSEFFIPIVIDALIKAQKVSVKILPTVSQWFGVTYREDRPSVVARFQALHDAGIYPADMID
ncbi:MAG: nucleotidyltransferase [Prevotellaceae bacterium]|nr:nucleotidyltransferase [Prevotellaceae bacterium]